MALETLFKIAFYILFFSFAYTMAVYSKKSTRRAANLAEGKKAHDEHEVPLLLKIRQLFGIPFYLGLLVWTFFPSLMGWSELALPLWIRWAGLGLGVLAVGLNGWSHWTLSRVLGPDFNPALRLLTVPALVTKGPYRLVRHPIYLAFLLMQIAVLLLTANWLIGFAGICIITAVILIRIPEEDKLLRYQFGAEYEAYMSHTGRLVPKFR